MGVIRETTREVSIPLTRLHDVRTDTWGNRRIGFEGALKIDRKDYLVDDAVEILRLNLSAYPDSGGALDSLAEAYAKAGNRRAAIENARRSLAVDPGDPGTIALLQWLEAHGAAS